MLSLVTDKEPEQRDLLPVVQKEGSCCGRGCAIITAPFVCIAQLVCAAFTWLANALACVCCCLSARNVQQLPASEEAKLAEISSGSCASSDSASDSNALKNSSVGSTDSQRVSEDANNSGYSVSPDSVNTGQKVEDMPAKKNSLKSAPREEQPREEQKVDSSSGQVDSDKKVDEKETKSKPRSAKILAMQAMLGNALENHGQQPPVKFATAPKSDDDKQPAVPEPAVSKTAIDPVSAAVAQKGPPPPPPSIGTTKKTWAKVNATQTTSDAPIAPKPKGTAKVAETTPHGKIAAMAAMAQAAIKQRKQKITNGTIVLNQ